MFPKIAIHGNFPLCYDHFISEIADCKQQPEILSLQQPLTAPTAIPKAHAV